MSMWFKSPDEQIYIVPSNVSSAWVAKNLPKALRITPLSVTVADLFEALPTTKHFDGQSLQLFAANSTENIFGVEIELEDLSMFYNGEDINVPVGWNHCEDGSLRNNGREFVSLPMAIPQLKTALNELDDFLEGRGEATSRCGVHVHVNVTHLSLEQVIAFVLLCYVVEPAIFSTTGSRQHNAFCVPFMESNRVHQVFSTLNMCLRARNFSDTIWVMHQIQRYMATNTAALGKYGTVEFRHMGATRNFSKIMKFVGVLNSLCNYAKSHSLSEILEEIIALNMTSSYENFYMKFFEGKYDSSKFNTQENIVKLRRHVAILKAELSFKDLESYKNSDAPDLSKLYKPSKTGKEKLNLWFENVVIQPAPPPQFADWAAHDVVPVQDEPF